MSGATVKRVRDLSAGESLKDDWELAMKLHFEPNLDYQLQAIEAVCDLFRGQEVCRTEFTVTHNAA